MGRSIGLLFTSLWMVGCGEATPLSVLVVNVAAGPVTLRGAPDREGLVLLEDAVFEKSHLVAVEFSLPDETWVEVDLAP